MLDLSREIPNESCVKLLKHTIGKDVRKLVGDWREVNKPVKEIVKILELLGVRSMKRNIIARWSCKMTLKILSSQAEDDLWEDTWSDGLSNGSVSSESSGGRSSSRWYQEQIFPLGQIRRAEFVDDGHSEWECVDTEIGTWNSLALSTEDGLLIQRRRNDDANLTMYDLRCCMDRKVDLNKIFQTGEIDYTEEPRESPVQLFEWIVVNHNKNDETVSAAYYLEPIK